MVTCSIINDHLHINVYLVHNVAYAKCNLSSLEFSNCSLFKRTNFIAVF